jgi:hypothetical protein
MSPGARLASPHFSFNFQQNRCVIESRSDWTVGSFIMKVSFGETRWLYRKALWIPFGHCRGAGLHNRNKNIGDLEMAKEVDQFIRRLLQKRFSEKGMENAGKRRKSITGS